MEVRQQMLHAWGLTIAEAKLRFGWIRELPWLIFILLLPRHRGSRA